MVLKPDQEHIRELLAETITLLCCNGLHFKSEFSIDALIGITLDQNEVFLVSIKETFENGRTVTAKKQQKQQPVVSRDMECSASWTCNDSSPLEIERKLRNSNSEHEIQADDLNNKKLVNAAKAFNSSCPKQRSNKRKHRIPSKFDSGQSELPGFSTQEEFSYGNLEKRFALDASENFNHCDVGEDSVEYLENSFTKTQAFKKNEDLQTSRMLCYGRSSEFATNCEERKSLELQDHSSCEFVQIKQEPVEKSLLPTSRSVKCSNSKNRHGGSLDRKNSCDFLSSIYSSNSLYLQLQDSVPGCSSWNRSESSDAMTQMFSNRNRWNFEPFEHHSSDVEIDKPPDLTELEISYARDILSVSGNFVNIGSVKAFHRNLRQLSHEGLSSLLKKMSVPKNSCYCVGVLCTDGVSRVFYKCPPMLLRSEAIAFYDLNVSAYTSAFDGLIKVSRRVLEPFEWIEKISKFSPYSSDKDGNI